MFPAGVHASDDEAREAAELSLLRERFEELAGEAGTASGAADMAWEVGGGPVFRPPFSLTLALRLRARRCWRVKGPVWERSTEGAESGSAREGGEGGEEEGAMVTDGGV